MNYKQLKTTPTIVLIDCLTKSTEEGDQFLINVFAYEIASRLYVPNNSYKTFEELLKDFGYKQIIEEEKPKIYTKKRK